VMAVHSSEEWKTERVQLTLHAELYIDAILGTGFKPPVSGLYAEAIATLNASTTPVVAVDIPSGADADVMGHQTGAVARANAIVTFTVPRSAHRRWLSSGSHDGAARGNRCGHNLDASS